MSRTINPSSRDGYSRAAHFLPIIEEPTRAQFERIITSQRPVILKGLSRHWDLNAWKPHRLCELIGREKVIGIMGQSHRSADCRPMVHRRRTNAIRFEDFIEWLGRAWFDCSQRLQAAVIGRTQPFTCLPQLRPILKVPAILQDKMLAGKLVLGPHGHRSQLHVDFRQNFLLQIQGSRLITLFHPAESSLLYPSQQSDQLVASPLDPHEPDLKRYSKFTRARSVIGHLEPGDSVYIPCGWWQELANDNGTNVSLNWWWNTRNERARISHDLVASALEAAETRDENA